MFGSYQTTNKDFVATDVHVELQLVSSYVQSKLRFWKVKNFYFYNHGTPTWTQTKNAGLEVTGYILLTMGASYLWVSFVTRKLVAAPGLEPGRPYEQRILQSFIGFRQ